MDGTHVAINQLTQDHKLIGQILATMATERSLTVYQRDIIGNVQAMFLRTLHCLKGGGERTLSSCAKRCALGIVQSVVCKLQLLARMGTDIDNMEAKIEAKVATWIQCMEWLFGKISTEDNDMESDAKGKGKGHRPVVVPMEPPNGPLWVEEGWVFGFKVFIGDLPHNVSKLEVSELATGQVDLAVNANRTRSGMAYSIVTFDNLDLAIECYKKASSVRFDHGQGGLHWASVKWFHGTKKKEEGQSQ